MDDRYPEIPVAWNRTEKVLLLAGVGTLFVIIIVARIVWAMVNAPTAEEAFRLSMIEFKDDNISKKTVIRRDVCSITGSPGFGWSVNCPGIYFDSTLGCRSVSWETDAWGIPTDFDGRRGRFNTISDECRAPTP